MASLNKVLPFLFTPAALLKKPKTAGAPALPDFATLLTQAADDQKALLAGQEVAAKKRNAAALRTANAGPRSTILTSGSGALGSAPTTQKTLLGQ